MTKSDVIPCKLLGEVSGYRYLDSAKDLGADVVLVHMTALGVPLASHPFHAYDCGGRYARGPTPTRTPTVTPTH